MKYLLFPLLVFSFLLSGCGKNTTIEGAIRPGTLAATGMVSIVHLTFVSDGNGGSTTVTVVTLLSSGSAQDLTFCGSQATQFPLNATVTARFTQGTTCSTLISVTTGP